MPRPSSRNPSEFWVARLVGGKGGSSHGDENGAGKELTEPHSDPETEGSQAAGPHYGDRRREAEGAECCDQGLWDEACRFAGHKREPLVLEFAQSVAGGVTSIILTRTFRSR
jgi:hypothetical protein